DGGAFQAQTTFPFTIQNVTSGPHTVEVRDLNGCGNMVNLNIELPLEITPLVTQIVSFLDNDGEITVMASGGTGTYTYTISPMPTTIALAANVFSGVPSGTYTVTITDTTTLCEKDVEVTLGAATPVTFTTTLTHVTCK